MLKLGEIDTSPWDDFPLSKLLLVALIVLIRTEECDVVPRLSASLSLLGLRWLNRVLALSPGSTCLLSRSHPKSKKKN